VDGLHVFLSNKPEEVVAKRTQQLLNDVKGLKEGAIHKLENFDKKDLEPLLNHIGDARCVMRIPVHTTLYTETAKAI
jgi:hypothetical protein